MESVGGRVGGIGELEREKLAQEKAYYGTLNEAAQPGAQMQAGEQKRMRARDVLLHRVRNEQNELLRKIASLEKTKDQIERASDRELETVLAVLEAAL